jgi:hypothetical protein
VLVGLYVGIAAIVSGSALLSRPYILSGYGDAVSVSTCTNTCNLAVCCHSITAQLLLHLQVDKDSVRKELVLSERQAQLTEAVLQFKEGQVVRAQVRSSSV